MADNSDALIQKLRDFAVSLSVEHGVWADTYVELLRQTVEEIKRLRSALESTVPRMTPEQYAMADKWEFGP